MLSSSDKSRFKEKLKTVEGGCLIWQAGVLQDGYGGFWLNRKSVRAHRVAWEIERGPVPAGAQVLHRCDVRLCCNPAHLFLGDHIANMEDRDAKGRTRKGENHPKTKLTDKDVKDVLRSPLSTREISKRMGVTFQCIWQIRKGLTRTA